MQTAIIRRGVNLDIVSIKGSASDGGDATDTSCRTTGVTQYDVSSFLERTRKCWRVPEARQSNITMPLEPEMKQTKVLRDKFYENEEGISLSARSPSRMENAYREVSGKWKFSSTSLYTNGGMQVCRKEAKFNCDWPSRESSS